MSHSFKKQFGVISSVLCLVMVFSITAPALLKADCNPEIDDCGDYAPGTVYPTASPAAPTYSPQQSAPASNNLTPIKDFTGLSSRLASIGTVVIYLLTALAVIYIVWNVVQALIKGKEGGDRKEALMHVMWGLIGLFIILSLWGLVNILLNTFGTDTTINMKSKLPQTDFVNSK